MTPRPAEPNEDPDFDPEEIVESAQEQPPDMIPPEVDPATAALTEWDAPPSATGRAAPKVLPEDDVPAAEVLIDEGLDEADREQRIAAADPDFEP
jgi:hypothetical protein